jgi:hypothetical protein
VPNPGTGEFVGRPDLLIRDRAATYPQERRSPAEPLLHFRAQLRVGQAVELNGEKMRVFDGAAHGAPPPWRLAV